MLTGLVAHAHPDLLVGLGASDDAAVYRVADGVAIVQTVDFFPPIVDDPYAYGAIAAANAMSDVYAMGGRVLFALNVAGFPRELPKAVVAAIFAGGADKVREAGGVIAGGHTVVDPEPKYGLCVTGSVDPRRLLVKGGLRPGQRLLLSKPLGTGVIATAAKAGAGPPEALASAIASMVRLNRAAAEVAVEHGATGATDVTGFGLLGHLAEMLEASRAGVALGAGALPLLPAAAALAEQGHWSGGMRRNRRHVEHTFGERLAIAASVPEAVRGLLFESETSGGLLFGVAPEHAEGARRDLEARGERCWEIGVVTAEPRIAVGD